MRLPCGPQGDKSTTMGVDLTAITAEEEAAESKRREEEEAKALEMLLASAYESAAEAVNETSDECATPTPPPSLSVIPRPWAETRLTPYRVQNAAHPACTRSRWRG